MSWKREPYRHSLASKGVKVRTTMKTNLLPDIEHRLSMFRHDSVINDKEFRAIQKLARKIVNDIPDTVYHRVNLVDFMNMILHPENTPRKLSTSTIFISEYNLEKWCTRTDRDISVRMKHIGCPVPKIYKSPFEGERDQFPKEEVLKFFMLDELRKKYERYCTNNITERDIIIGGNYPEEHEITYIMPVTGENLANNVVEIIPSPHMNILGVKRNIEHTGRKELLDKVRPEIPEDSYELNRFMEARKK